MTTAAPLPRFATMADVIDELNGGDLLAGFSLPLSRLFGELDQQAP